MKANREIKDSVFRMLFKKKRTLIRLYNALTGSNLPPDTSVEITTLTNILYNSWRDDLAFVINGRLVILIEHQSTINENMPLRLLIYIARVYEKLIDQKALYKRLLLKIPKPDFIVLYNGKEPFPEEKDLRLSDAFESMPDTEGLGGFLDLTVRVININFGHNEKITKRCAELDGYVKFNQRINEKQAAGLNNGEAVEQAIKECAKEGILPGFLKEHGSEVLNLMTLIYNEEEAKKVAHEEGIERGIEKGQSMGLIKAALKMLDAGYEPDEVSSVLGIPKMEFMRDI